MLLLASVAVAITALVVVHRMGVPSAAEQPPEPEDDQPDLEEAREAHEPPPELISGWVQFLRDHVTDAANGLNNRMSAILGLVQRLDSPNLTEDQASGLKRIQTEIKWATNITRSLLHRVTSEAPDLPPPAWNLLRDGPTRPGRILVVEDDESNRTVITKLFQHLGHTVIPAGSGIEGWEVLERESADLDCIICDLVMPTLGGKNLFEQVEEGMPSLARRFVFVTGDYTRPESHEFLLRTGQPVVGKPYEVEQLLSAVATIFGEVGVIIRGEG